jgi:hypothetical protein
MPAFGFLLLVSTGQNRTIKQNVGRQAAAADDWQAGLNEHQRFQASRPCQLSGMPTLPATPVCGRLSPGHQSGSGPLFVRRI